MICISNLAELPARLRATAECIILGRDFGLAALADDLYAAAQAIETRSAKTAGLGPKDESAVPNGNASETGSHTEARGG